jgi:hypothetical protein
MLWKWLYFEFLHPTRDYCKTVDRSERVFDLAIPILATGLLYWFAGPDLQGLDARGIMSDALTLLAILIGFSITSLTVLASGSETSLKTLCQHTSNRSLNGKTLSLYQLLTTIMSHTLVVEILTLLSALTYLFLKPDSSHNIGAVVWFFANMGLVIHAICLQLRIVANFYFTLQNTAKKRKGET